jgi:hypothetical protein
MTLCVTTEARDAAGELAGIFCAGFCDDLQGFDVAAFSSSAANVMKVNGARHDLEKFVSRGASIPSTRRWLH